jgi:Ribosomal protein L13
MILAVRYHIYLNPFIHYSSGSLSGNIVDCGDYVIVTNSIKVKVSGKKEQQFLFRKHSMFPGGLKETPYKDMKKRHPEEVRFIVVFLVCVMM